MKTKLLEIYLYNYKICFFLFISISFCNNYIVFPIKIKNEEKLINVNIDSASEYIEFINNNKVAINILIGTPQKIIEIYLTSERMDFILGEGFCSLNPNSNYNTSLSTSFKNTKVGYTSPSFINGFLSNENITLYSDLNLSKTVSFQNFDFINCNPSPVIFDIIDRNNFCGYLGLQISSSNEYFEWNSIIYQLKTERYILNQKWSIIFNQNKITNYDGALILGIKEEEYKDFFNIRSLENNEFKIIYSSKTFSNSNYGIKFDEIYYHFDNQKYNFLKFIEGIFVIDYDYIIANEQYFDSIKNSFFYKFIENKLCFIDKSKKFIKTKKSDMLLLNAILCDKSKISINELKNFPVLKLKHINLDEIFEFNYEDLFHETKKYFIFKILLNENNKRVWNFGRIFLKKYQFIFDNDQKTITYIGINKPEENIETNEEEESEKNFFKNKIYLILIIVILIIGIGVLVGLFLGKKFCNQHKKKRANELDDDYEYIEKKNNPNEGIGIGLDDND